MEGFKAFIWKTPQARITDYAVFFNGKVRELIGDTPYLRIGFSDDGTLMGIEGSRERDEYTTSTGRNAQNGDIQISKGALVKEVERRTHWDLKSYSYRISGKFYKGIVVFDLKSAKKTKREHYKEV